ncbi:carbon-nitrogen hydrolase [Aliifodinibius halophilus]|uniref:Carbon-nitrogen hydrolase n=1 Tax=Fodinibius halophilus TaxID=1736908 RepID=A0A6M1T4W3_9BACT|nr:carbon-nitrogen hydrolase [Fodinibius halophilus]
MKKNVELALIQSACSADITENIDKATNKIEDAARKGAQIIILQELFQTPYFCQTINEEFFDWAQPIPGPLTDKLTTLARDLEVVIVAPFFEQRAAGIYHNSLVVIDADGTLMGRYRKQHIPDDPCFHEKFYFTPGDDGYKVFNTRFAKIGTLICWDQWYPEAARITALKGAELLVYPTAIGTLPHEKGKEKKEFLDAWQTIQKSHAIANSCFVAAVNRTGQEGKISFWGHSFVSGPFGKILAEAGDDDEVLIVDIDLSQIESQRRIWPFYRDRRIDTYQPIVKRYIENE